MKPTELRIGNYVNYIFKTLSIDAPEYKIKNGADIQLHQSNNLYKPIPLTEQWLKDFGFREDGYRWHKSHPFYIEWFRDWTPDGWWLMKDTETPICLIKYVHQLQNLYFALTGEELIK